MQTQRKSMRQNTLASGHLFLLTGLILLGATAAFGEPPAKDTTGTVVDNTTPPAATTARKRPTPPPTKNGIYCVVPLHGEIGAAVTATSVHEAFKDAARRGIKIIILDVRSGGGKVSQIAPIAQILGAYGRSQRVIVFVRDAMSAAALISLAVPEIYMQPTGRIGAATPYKLTPDGTAAAVQEKYQSALRALARGLAQMGGHAPRLADAMIDADVELHLVKIKGQKIVREGVGPNPITTKGKLLALSGPEAVACGLANGLARNYAELGKKLGMPNWTQAPRATATLTDTKKRDAEAVRAKFTTKKNAYTALAQQARAANPQTRTFPCHLGGTLTARGKVQWKRQEKQCLALLDKGNDTLKALAMLARKHPATLGNPVWISRESAAIQTFRQVLQAQRKRKGITGR